jgi:hypothetical protein
MKGNKYAYGSIILVPILINVITQSIDFKTVLANWYFTLVIILILTILILSYELIYARKLLSNVKEIDKQKITLLLNKLDINAFQRDIVEVDSWNGYRQDAITRILDFLENATLLQFKTSDDKLNKLMSDFVVQLNEFSSFTAMHVVGGNHHFIPITKKELDFGKRKAETEEMNRLAELAYQKLEILMRYVRKKNYIEN